MKQSPIIFKGKTGVVYRCEARSVREFIRRLAVDFVPHGYVFYVQGEIPDGKEPEKTDRKIIEQYGIDVSKWTRSRRKRGGIARLQYVRLGREFVILATCGSHHFFQNEAAGVRDIRRSTLILRDFSILGHNGKITVRVRRSEGR